MAEEIKTEEPAKKDSSAAGKVFGVAVLAAASFTAGWLVCSLWDGFSGKGGAGAPGMPQMPPPTVSVRPVELRPYNLPERYVAHAEAVQEVDLLPQVDGYIKEIKFKEGDTVQEGQLLYVLDDERYQAVVNQRKADLKAAETEAERAQRYWNRMQKVDARGITQLQRDNAEAEAEKSQSAVLQARANLVVAEYDLKKAKVLAPISGQIGKTKAHVGDYVAPSKGALARIVQVDPIRVTFPMTDRAYIDWRESQKAGKSEDRRLRLMLPNGKVYDQKGSWDFDDNQMSAETATIVMRLSFPNPDRLLVPNSYVTVLSDYNNPPKMLCVAEQALVVLPGGEQGLYILKDDQTVEQRQVKTLEKLGDRVAIVSGVKEGENVVISGVNKLANGVKVIVVEPTGNDDLDPNYTPPVKE